MGTLQDISKITGVSPSTISRILNNDTSLSVKDETRKKVLEAAEKAKYPIRQKGKGEPSLFLLAICSYSKDIEFSDPYYLSIRLSIEEECLRMGIGLTQSYGGVVPGHIAVDGILAVGQFSLEQISHIGKLSPHVIFVDSPFSDDFDCIFPDLKEISQKIIDYFRSCGYGKIGYIGGRDSVDIPDERELAFTLYASHHQVIDRAHIYIGEFLSTSGYHLARQMIAKQSLPDALFIANDTMALGVLKALNENKILIPEQIALISVNDIPASAFMHPSLSTVRIDTHLMGQQAVRILEDRIGTGRSSPLKIIVPFEFVMRESTLSLPNTLLSSRETPPSF